jgi:hypothetical protein
MKLGGQELSHAQPPRRTEVLENQAFVKHLREEEAAIPTAAAQWARISCRWRREICVRRRATPHERSAGGVRHAVHGQADSSGIVV